MQAVKNPIASLELSRLDGAGLAGELALPAPRCVLARHRAALLEHPQAGLSALNPAFRFEDGLGLQGLRGRLFKALKDTGLPVRAREALLAEVAHLADLFSGLAGDPEPIVRMEALPAGRPPGEPLLPATTGLALLYAFGDGAEGTAAVLKLDRGTPEDDGLFEAALDALDGPGRHRLLLSLASELDPDDWLQGRAGPWPPVTAPEPVPVLLLSMPFGPLLVPSLGLSLLKKVLPDGAAKVIYFGLPFARRIGAGLYSTISDLLPYPTAMAGEWLFRHELHDESPGEVERYLAEVLLAPTERWRADLGDEPSQVTLIPESQLADLLQARKSAGEFLDHCVDQVLAHRPRIVGLTSLYQQHAATLAFARRLKRRAPEIRIVLGGANCEGTMGLAALRHFEFLDAVVSGEGETVLPEIVERWLAGRSVDGLRGVYTRRSPEVGERAPAPASAPSPQHLDDLPYPDFTDYFAQFAAAGFAGRYHPRLVFETSRGCWWGEKSHCTFCGINGAGMAYRSKSAERALAELRELARRHPGLRVGTVDNILDMRYFETFLPRLAEEGLDLELFYEVKANLRKPQVRMLRQAGVTSIQAGIESFGDETLRIMGKGLKAMQGIALLKWCEELGVWPFWNVIWGFPGEPPEEYEEMAELVPLLYHLAPPEAISPIFVERFSPNFFRSEEMGFADVRAMAVYRYLYPFPAEDLHDLAFFFDYGYREPRDVAHYTAPLAERLMEWRDEYENSTLKVIDRGDHLLVCDTRRVAEEGLSFIDGLARTLYLACDEPVTIDQLCRSTGASRESVEEALQPLIDSKILLRRGQSVLALAVSAVLDGKRKPPS